MDRRLPFPALPLVALSTLLMLSAPAAAEPPAAAVPSTAAEPDPSVSDVECLVDVARVKGQLGEADKRRADLAMMYFLGRLSARMSEIELAVAIDRLPRRSPQEQASVRRRCAADLITSGIFLVAVNKALAEAAKSVAPPGGWPLRGRRPPDAER